MLNNISFYMIWKFPLVAWLGLLNLALFITTGVIGYMVTQGKIKFKYHKLFVYITFFCILVHGTLAVLSFL